MCHHLPRSVEEFVAEYFRFSQGLIIEDGVEGQSTLSVPSTITRFGKLPLQSGRDVPRPA
jgi:hypothetical protein